LTLSSITVKRITASADTGEAAKRPMAEYRRPLSVLALEPVEAGRSGFRAPHYPGNCRIPSLDRWALGVGDEGEVRESTL